MSNQDKPRAKEANRVVIRNLDDDGFRNVLDELRAHFDTKFNNKAVQLASVNYIPNIHDHQEREKELLDKISKLEEDLRKMAEYSKKLSTQWERFCQGVAMKEASYEELETLVSDGPPVNVPGNQTLNMYRDLMKA